MKTLTDQDFIKFLGKQESQFLAPASQWADDVVNRFAGGHQIYGDKLPWSKTHNLFRFRPGEVTLWGGYSGHGKSLMLGQVCAWSLKQKWLVASMEMSPAATMERMTRQVAGNNSPTENFVRGWLESTNDRLWIYDQTDSVKSDRILGMVHYAAQELHVEHIVIDSLIKCGIGREDYEAQARFVDRLCWAAKNENVHIHLVHHMRKGINEFTRPTKTDFRGAGELTDLVDNVLIVYRNKSKEKKIAMGETVDAEDADCFLAIEKQRHFEWEGLFKLWVNPESMQFVPGSGGRVMNIPL